MRRGTLDDYHAYRASLPFGRAAEPFVIVMTGPAKRTMAASYPGAVEVADLRRRLATHTAPTPAHPGSREVAELRRRLGEVDRKSVSTPGSRRVGTVR